MGTSDVSQLHKDAWMRLFELNGQGVRLLGELSRMAILASDFNDGTAVFTEFDLEAAQGILEKLRMLTPRVYARIEEVNRYAEQSDQPVITRVRL